MKKLILLPIALLLVLAFAYHICAIQYISGPLEGFVGPDSFIVMGNISVENGDSLTILPPSTFLFNNASFGFNIYGYLSAIGNLSDSIKFILNTGVSSWQGINFESIDIDSNIMEYCVITSSISSGISGNSTSLILNNCSIRNNSSNSVSGGGLYFTNSIISINNSTIRYNSINTYGPIYGIGVFLNNCTASIIECEFSNNVGDPSGSYSNGISWGGGIYCTNSTVVDFINCIFSENSVNGYQQSGGGALMCTNCQNINITDCDFNNNTSTRWTGFVACTKGGAIYINSCTNTNIFNCTFYNNISVGSGNDYGGGAIFISSSNPQINSCTFSENHNNSIHCVTSNPYILDCSISNSNGAAIYLYNNSNSIIDNCFVSNNNSNAIYINGSEPSISNSHILENNSSGIYCDNYSDPIIDSCFISTNSTGGFGGGIRCNNSSPNISYTTICENSAISTSVSGGGISIENDSHPTITNCTITRNSAPNGSGGGIYCGENSYFNMVNTIVDSNTGFGGIHFDYTNISSLTYSDFYNNQNGNFTGYPPAGLGNITGVNLNGDPCDDYFNIFLDPQFVNPDSDNFNLQTTSPCIDAGDPTLNWDPDGTLPDIGAFFYDQILPVINLSSDSLLFPETAIGDTTELPIVVYNISTGDLIIDSMSLSMLDIFSTDWNLEDSLIVPEDSLEILIAFSPQDTLEYTDNLLIYNNDTLAQVFLQGFELTVGVERIITLDIPETYNLYTPYPNPFNPKTILRFDLRNACNVSLFIYDIQGREVARLVDSFQPDGTYETTFNASELSSGVYFARLTAGEFHQTQKLLLIK